MLAAAGGLERLDHAPEHAAAAGGSATCRRARRPAARTPGPGVRPRASTRRCRCRSESPGLDALIDVLAPIAVEAPVSGEAALAAMPTTRRAGSKPFAIEGLNEATQQWETPQPGQRYSAFQAGVQLANRTGALNEIEFSEFVMKAQAFADAVNGAPEFPEMLDEVARARELDQFASGHDAQLGFTLRARMPPGAPATCSRTPRAWASSPGAIPGRMVLPARRAGHAAGAGPVVRHAGRAGRRPGAVGASAS